MRNDRRLAALLLALMLLVSGCAAPEPAPGPEEEYQRAILLLQEGKTAEAAPVFAELGHYYSAAQYEVYCKALMAAESG